jgi:hypothetical protein
MLAALASAALIVAGSLAVGHALLRLCGTREPTWLAGPVGLAALLFLSSLLATLGGRGPTIAISLAAAVLAAAAYLAIARRRGGVALREPPQHGREDGAEHGRGAAPEGLRRLGAPMLAAVLAATFAALPFITAGNVGILGVGLVNDDMASHLLIADWLDERFRPEPVFIDQGYPLGPHALVAGLSTLLGASSIDAFAGLTLAIPTLTALVAFAALGGLSPIARTLCAVVVALPYMAAAYLAQEAFKEPLLALFLLSFAILLPTVRSAREAIPLGVLAAGVIYVYSFPGLAWLIGTGVVWASIELWRGRQVSRNGLLAAGFAAVALVLLVIAEIPRLVDFIDYRALDPDRANDGGLGNLREQLSPLTAFGVWPTSEFRLSAGAGSLPAAVFYAGALLGAAALALGLPRWIRRHGPAIPAALATAVALYVFARSWGTVYTSAKAIAIAAPLITLIALGGLLADRRTIAGRWVAPALAALVAVGTTFSSFLILRQAPVGPEDHMQELAEIRPLVEGEKVLFLGRDNFVLNELRGSRPFVAVRNYYVPDSLYVKPNAELRDVFAKFDFDSVTARTLADFPYVLTTRATYASAPPPRYEVAAQTESYVLWHARGRVLDRVPGETGPEPGAVARCGREEPASRAAVAFTRRPIVVAEGRWSASTLESGSRSTLTFDLPRGEWRISLRYDATRPVTLSAGPTSLEERLEIAELPGNLDYRGPAPFWPAGAIEVAGRGGASEVEIVAEVEDPPPLGRVLGAEAVAHLGELAAAPAGEGFAGGETPLPGEGRRLVSGGEACGEYVDWELARPGAPAQSP